MRLVFCGLDPSLTATGVVDSHDLKPRLISPARGMRGAERLLYLHQEIERATSGADLVCLEGYAFGAKGRAVYGLGELGGVIRLNLHCQGRAWVEIPPQIVKKLATGKGNAPKEAVLQAAWSRLGYEGHDHNIADALWLMQCGLVHYGQPGAAAVPKSHVGVLEKVAWPDLDQLSKSAA